MQLWPCTALVCRCCSQYLYRAVKYFFFPSELLIAAIKKEINTADHKYVWWKLYFNGSVQDKYKKMAKGCRLPAITLHLFGEHFAYEIESSDFFCLCVSTTNQWIMRFLKIPYPCLLQWLFPVLVFLSFEVLLGWEFKNITRGIYRQNFTK